MLKPFYGGAALLNEFSSSGCRVGDVLRVYILLRGIVFVLIQTPKCCGKELMYFAVQMLRWSCLIKKIYQACA